MQGQLLNFRLLDKMASSLSKKVVQQIQNATILRTDQAHHTEFKCLGKRKVRIENAFNDGISNPLSKDQKPDYDSKSSPYTHCH